MEAGLQKAQALVRSLNSQVGRKRAGDQIAGDNDVISLPNVLRPLPKFKTTGI